jgi:hypothetical protein
MSIIDITKTLSLSPCENDLCLRLTSLLPKNTTRYALVLLQMHLTAQPDPSLITFNSKFTEYYPNNTLHRSKKTG